MRKNMAEKGSITLEAAIILPIFIVAIMSFVFIIKLYYTQEIVQQAITGACNEMSVYSLLYYETNAEEVIGGIEKFSNSQEVSELFGDSEITSYIQLLGKEATDYIRAQVALVPITKYLVKKNLSLGKSYNADDRLKNLNLDEGFEGMDFSNSRMLSDGKSIDVVVKYELKFPFLTQLFPGLKITQTASGCIWAGEDGIPTTEESQENVKSVWDMNNVQRGREIRKMQGANLPFNFPAIANFQNGTATSIKSLNIDEVYYHNSNNLKQKLVALINKLEDFDGGESSTISVESYQILKKELRLVIPETDLTANQQQTINECIRIANSKGIDLKVVKAYGKQNTVNEGDVVKDDTSNK